MNDDDRNSSKDTIETSLFYLVDPKQSARDDRTGWPGRSAPYPVTIANARKLANPSLDREGFMPVQHESAVANFYDAEEVRRTYYPELVDLLTQVTGAEKVVIFAHDVRNSDATKQDG